MPPAWRFHREPKLQWGGGGRESLSRMDTEGQEETTKESRTQAGKLQGGRLRLGGAIGRALRPREGILLLGLTAREGSMRGQPRAHPQPLVFHLGNQLGEVTVSNHT